MKKNTETTKNTATKKVERVNKETLIELMKKLDNNVVERKTVNDDVALEIFDTSSPKTRCGLWQRGATGKRYDLYIGNETILYNRAKTIEHSTYVDDKKMSKKEIAFMKMSFDDLQKLITQLTKTETKTTKTKSTKKVSKTA